MAKKNKQLEAEMVRGLFFYFLGLIALVLGGIGALYMESSMAVIKVIFGYVVLFTMLQFLAILAHKMHVRYQSLSEEIEKEV